MMMLHHHRVLLRRRPAVAPLVRKLFHVTSYMSRQDDISASVIVPTLGQNSTLVLRSQSANLSQVLIKPQWRDDTLLELIRDADNGVIYAFATATADISNESERIHQRTFGGMQLTFHKDGTKTSLGRVGSYAEVDLLQQNDSEDTITGSWKLVATVPEKCNITCQVEGDINVDGKLEGDAHLSTSNIANITAGKLRGHNVTLNNTALITAAAQADINKGAIYIKNAIEARTVHINASQRVRARMINGSDIQIQASPSNTIRSNKLDEDDEGAVIDIGSLYISHGGGDSEAQLNVDANNLSDASSGGIVRVKSNHGHVTINAKVTSNPVANDTPLVDLGGVNGSCDVLIEASEKSRNLERTPKKNLANRIHFDAFTPESISTITSRGHVGCTSITIDRKLDAELRLLGSAATLPYDVDAHLLSSDEPEDIKSILNGLNRLSSQNNAQQQQLDSISIETDTFQASDDGIQTTSSAVQYTIGTVKNRSGEPDSRFDIQSRGKINKDGAASQALHGFHSKPKEDIVTDDEHEESENILPLLSVATDGNIKLETLSWLGSIARRYGLEENQQITLGRQASRKPLGWRREWGETDRPA